MNDNKHTMNFYPYLLLISLFNLIGFIFGIVIAAFFAWTGFIIWLIIWALSLWIFTKKFKIEGE